jgi:hypothetical protein
MRFYCVWYNSVVIFFFILLYKNEQKMNKMKTMKKPKGVFYKNGIYK